MSWKSITCAKRGPYDPLAARPNRALQKQHANQPMVGGKVDKHQIHLRTDGMLTTASGVSGCDRKRIAIGRVINISCMALSKDEAFDLVVLYTFLFLYF